jgi:PAS domain S-box-containing protein
MSIKQPANNRQKAGARVQPEKTGLDSAPQQACQILDAWFDAAIITDSDGIILQANTACRNMLGYCTKELIGRAADFLYASPGNSSLTEAHCITKQGLAIPVEQKSTPVFNSTGQASGILTVMRDRTVELALRTAEERFRTFFEYAPDAIYISDVNGIFIDGNRIAEQLCGYNRAELIGKNYFDLEILSAEQFPQAMELLERNMAGSPTGPDEFILHQRGGALVTVEICTYPVYIQGQRCVLGVARDITGRKQAETALKKAHEELEIKVRERTQDLEEANIALRVLLKSRDDDRSSLEQSMLHNLHELVLPCVEKLKAGRLQERQRAVLGLLETNLRDITAPMLRALTMQHLRFTHAEISVASCIRQGKSTRDIAAQLQLSIKTVQFHRENIRRKCGLKNKKVNLKTFLASLA